MTNFRLERTGKIIFTIGLCVNIAHRSLHRKMVGAFAIPKRYAFRYAEMPKQSLFSGLQHFRQLATKSKCGRS